MTGAMKLVPVRITPEMAHALESNFAICTDPSEVHAANWQDAWSKALAASPDDPASEVAVVKGVVKLQDDLDRLADHFTDLYSAAHDAAIALAAVLAAPEDESRRPHAQHLLGRLKDALRARAPGPEAVEAVVS